MSLSQGADSIKVKDKGHPRTVYEVPEIEYKYSFSLFNLAARWG
jgi:hypothetical protein